MPRTVKHLPQDVTGRRRDWVPIAVNLGQDDVAKAHLLQCARERRWRLVSLAKFGGQLGGDVQVRGALVDKLPDSPLVRELLQRGVPTVRIGKWPHPDDHLVPAAMTDWAACGTLAAQHYAEREFEHVACIGFEPWGDNLAVYEAFTKRAQELGLACHLLRYKEASEFEGLDTAHKWEARQREFTAWMRQLPKPVGLLSFGDAAADRAGYWAEAMDLRVPEDLAILGIGNDVFTCECAKIPLSSIAGDTNRVVETAVDLLARRINNEPIPEKTVRIPPAGVVMRQSTDVLAASDPSVVRALRFMWNHIADDLSVDQIADHVGVSRRTLERAFQKSLGRGINQEFQRRRLDRSCHLLTHTELLIGAVSEALGFSSQKYFCESFRSVYGLSPTQFRNRRRTSVMVIPPGRSVA